MNKGALIRTIILALALLNQVLVNLGYSPIPIDDTLIEMTITNLFTLVSVLWAWWKNTPVTKEAKEADRYLKDLRERKAKGF